MSDPDRCPACPEARALLVRDLAEAVVRECTACGGVWIGREVIHTLGERARADLLPLWVGAPVIAPQGGSADRLCPVCGTRMSRRPCGVVVDVCSTHGVWFDREELGRFVVWVRERAEAHLQAVSGARFAPTAGLTFARTPPPGDCFGGYGSGPVAGFDQCCDLVCGILLSLVSFGD